MHGAAVVAARIGGIPELVDDGVNGFLYDAFRAEDLRDRLQQFIDDPMLATRMASAAPAVKSIVQDAQQWERRYESVLALRSDLARAASL